jgi:hypothetical protein
MRFASLTHPSPFKGEVRRGMGCLLSDAKYLISPIPTPTLPLKGREFEVRDAGKGQRKVCV